MEINPRWANYFDNAATTPLDPRVLEAMLPYLGDEFGNAHSIHQWGSRAMAVVERAREQIATAIGFPPDSIVITSGATEANNWIIRQFKEGIVSPFEHDSVREPALAAGFEVCGNRGLDLTQRDSSRFRPHEFQSVALVNNEIGTRIGPNYSITGSFQHSDITQALGKLETFGIASLRTAVTASAHKVYGPKGIGLLASEALDEPMILGGEQERHLRAGTLQVASIVGFGAACELIDEAREPDWTRAETMRNVVLQKLATTPDWRVNGVPDEPDEFLSHVPHILSISFLGVEGESLVIETDNAGFAISAGAACSSRSTEPSHVLTALGLEPEWIRGTVRISFGRFNTVEAAAKLGKTLANAVERLRSLRS